MARSIVTLACLAVVAACTSDYEDLCNDWAQCVKGGDTDIDACIAYYEGREDWASEAECEAEYETWFSCYESQADCQRIDSIGFWNVDNVCGAKDQALEDCLKNWRH